MMMRFPSTIVLVALAACNEPPTDPSVTLEPAAPTTVDDLVATFLEPVTDANKSDVPRITFTWEVRPAGASEFESRPEITGDRVVSDLTSRGETWRVTVVATDGEATTEEVAAETTVLDTAPEVSFVRLTPDSVDTLGILSASWGTLDVDGDEVTARIKWYLDGQPLDVTTTTLGGEFFERGEAVEIEVTPFDGELEGTPVRSTPVIVANSPPKAEGAVIGPENPDESTTLTCDPVGWFDLDGDAPTVDVVWYVNGDAVASTPTLTGANFAKGDLIRCQATPNDGADKGPTVVSPVIVVGNSAPSISGVKLDNTSPKAAEDLTFTVSGATDPDGDPVSYLATWIIDGEEAATGNVLPAGSFKRDQQISVVVIPTDGIGVGEPVESDEATVINSAPVMTTVTLKPDILYTNDSAFPSVDAVDADGDRITYTKTWLVNGTAVSATGAVLDGLTWFDRDDTVQVEVQASDGLEKSAALRSGVITVLNSPPTKPGVSITPEKPRTGENLVCLVTLASTDADSDTLETTVTWKRNGSPFTGATTTTVTGDTIPGSTPADGDTFECNWKVSDGVASAEATATVRVQNWAGPRNFTSCSASGAYGPTQSACNSAYSATTLTGEVTVTSGVQIWEVPQTGTYRIEAWGAQGAQGTGSYGAPLGARMRGDFSLTKGTKLRIIVGQRGTANGQRAGGGGASWIVREDGTALVVAGGGGGLGYAYSSSSGCDGQSGTAARAPGYYSFSCGSSSTSSGGGGTYLADGYSYYPYYEYYYYYGNGGAGFNVDGGTWSTSLRARSYKNGAQGGDGSYTDGGFGGGGSGDSRYYEYDYYYGSYTYDEYYGGGGGGGYTGGDGSTYVGGGGSSFNTGTNASNSSAAWAGNGKVTIDLAP